MGLAPSAAPDTKYLVLNHGRWGWDWSQGRREKPLRAEAICQLIERDFNILMTGMVLSIAHQAEFTPHSLRLLLLGGMRWELPRGHKSSGVSEVR